MMNALFDDIQSLLVVHNHDERPFWWCSITFGCSYRRHAEEAPIPPRGKQVPGAEINGQVLLTHNEKAVEGFWLSFFLSSKRINLCGMLKTTFMKKGSRYGKKI
jgi:hypothetical protein